MGADAEALLLGSAAAAAAALQRHEVSAVELLERLLRRIERVNPALNAIVTPMTESARVRAGEADRALARGQRWGPLHGVPVTVKDTFETAGVRTTAGAPSLATYVPDRDATVVERLRRAGAVLVGKTNTPLLASDWQADNEIFGRTLNPWSADHTPGGSSGGCAAAVAAGLSFLSVGSDIGGSVRIPAAFCGLFGHKPTLGLVPLRGHVPPLPGSPPGAFVEELPVAGPLARSAADLALALEALGGAVDEHALAWRWTLPPPRRSRLGDYRVGVVIDDPYCPVTAETRTALAAGVAALREAGAEVEEGWPEGVDPERAFRTYFYLLSQAIDGAQPPEVHDAIRAAAASGEIPALRARALDDRFHDARVARIEQEQERALWARFFSSRDAFLSPVSFAPAFRHDPSLPLEARVIPTPEGDRSYQELLRWIAIPTLTGCPATSAPVGVGASGLPIGIQIMGPYLEDATPIHLAGALVEAVGGYRPPPALR